uniref:Uncharacterized protein n=1 Tax=Arundo donax TaxID=35708 RepID=A0A0A9EFG0_ARUDO
MMTALLWVGLFSSIFPFILLCLLLLSKQHNAYESLLLFQAYKPFTVAAGSYATSHQLFF